MADEGLSLEQARPGPIDEAGDDLIRIVAVLANELEQFDVHLSKASVRLVQQARRGGSANPAQARRQWNRIRTDAAQIASRTHQALEQINRVGG